jgi:hypothetical protein
MASGSFYRRFSYICIAAIATIVVVIYVSYSLLIDAYTPSSSSRLIPPSRPAIDSNLLSGQVRIEGLASWDSVNKSAGFNLSNCLAQPGSYTLNYISNSSAQCIDGSRAAYYFRRGFGAGANKWIIFFEGGGWCYNTSECVYRSTTRLGSSSSYLKCVAPTRHKHLPYWSSFLSHHVKKNKRLYNHNVVYMKYCDGGSFAGNNDLKTPEVSLVVTIVGSSS